MKSILTCLFFALYSIAIAQPTVFPDYSFNISDNGDNGDNRGFNDDVRFVTEQADGKIIVGGLFTSYNSSDHAHIARLLVNGKIDTSFHSGSGFNNTNNIQIKALPNGKILVTGWFTTYNGEPANRIVRLNSDGTIDLTFQSGIGFNNNVLSFDVQASGRIAVVGLFNSYNGTSVNGIVVLNPNGTIFTGFNSPAQGISTSGFSRVRYVGADSLLIGGSFTNYNGTGMSYMIRYTPNGTHDLAFNYTPPSGVTDLSGFDIDPNTGFLYGVKAYKLMRFSSTGQIDASFGISGSITLPDYARTLTILNNSIYVILNPSAGYIQKRALGSGVLDTSFGTISGDCLAYFGGYIYTNYFTPDELGKIQKVETTTGAISADFHPMSGSIRVLTACQSPDGKIYIVGRFNDHDEVSLKRLNQSGEVDTSFSTALLANKMVFLPNGRLLIATIVNSNTTIRQLLPDGSIDPNFNVYTTFQNYWVLKMIVQPNGKILCLRRHFTLNSSIIDRLNADGSDDISFNDIVINGTIKDLAIRADGKLFISLAYNYTTPGQILQVYENNGVLVPGMFSGTIGTVAHSLTFNSAGDLFFLGQVNSINSVIFSNGNTTSNLYKFFAYSENTDLPFYQNHWNSSFPTDYSGILLQNDNKIIGYGTGFLTRYWPNGLSDQTFQVDYYSTSSPYSNQIYGQFLDGQENIVLYGEFDYDGFVRKNGIGRMINVGNPTNCGYFQGVFQDVSGLTCSSTVDSISAEGLFGTAPYSYLWLSGSSSTQATIGVSVPGSYTCKITDGVGCQKTISVLVDGPSNLGAYDLTTNLITTEFRPGFQTNSFIKTRNLGCVGTSSQITLNLDPAIQFVASTPAPTQINGSTVIWNQASLAFDSLYAGIIQLITLTDLSVGAGSLVNISLQVSPVVGDADTLNNTRLYEFVVVNGYDPNDKKSFPQGKCDTKYFESDKKLTYTIRFQNTGNSEAINILIKDVLSPNFDITSLKIIAQSHSMRTEISNGALQFYFDDIYLPDSSSSQFESQGFVIFEVSLLNPQSHNVFIPNSARIYFDFNLPILTNLVGLTSFNPDFYGPLVDFSCSQAGNPEMISDLNHLRVYPNPASQVLYVDLSEVVAESVQMSDLFGNIVLTSIPTNDKLHELDCSSLKPGVYLLLVLSSDRNRCVKVLIE